MPPTGPFIPDVQSPFVVQGSTAVTLISVPPCAAFFYRVSAEDGAGNVSGLSEEGTTTTRGCGSFTVSHVLDLGSIAGEITDLTSGNIYGSGPPGVVVGGLLDPAVIGWDPALTPPFRITPIPARNLGHLVRLGDFDNDGVNDLVTATPSGSIYIARAVHVPGAAPSYAFPPQQSGFANTVADLTVGDFDYNGDADCAVINDPQSTFQELTVFGGTGSASLFAAARERMYHPVTARPTPATTLAAVPDALHRGSDLVIGRAELPPAHPRSTIERFSLGPTGETFYAWRRLSPPVSPPRRVDQAMASFSAPGSFVSDGVLLFGGYDANTQTILGDTWSFNGLTWTPLGGSGPSPRFRHAMARRGLGTVTLFGGQGVSTVETWEWTFGAGWTRRFPSRQPPGSIDGAMAYHSGTNRVIHFGGFTGSASNNAQTWEWDGVDWTQRTTLPAQTPGGRHSHAMAAVSQDLVLFGGRDFAGNDLNDMWEWDGTRWHDRTPANGGPSARRSPGLASWGGRASVLLFGGRVGNSAQMFSDSWEWSNVWTNPRVTSSPPPSAGSGIVASGPDSRITFFDWDQTWTLGARMLQEVASERSHPAAAPRVVRGFGRGVRKLLVSGSRGGIGTVEGLEADQLTTLWRLSPIQSDVPPGAAVGDFDGDGSQDDLVLVRPDPSPSVEIYLDVGTSPEPVRYSSQLPLLPGAQARVATGDFNSDGFEDFAVTRGSLVELWLATGRRQS